MENNYSVYQHVTPDGMYYFGQTNDIKRRWSNNGADYKRTSLQPYIEKFGWDNIQHIVLFKDQTKENALWIEDFLITTAREDGVCINQRRSGNISKEEGYKREYCQKNKDKKRDYDKQYYEQNKDNINERHKQYQEKNTHDIKQYQKQYYEKNREKIREYQRQYYQRKRQDK